MEEAVRVAEAATVSRESGAFCREVFQLAARPLSSRAKPSSKRAACLLLKRHPSVRGKAYGCVGRAALQSPKQRKDFPSAGLIRLQAAVPICQNRLNNSGQTKCDSALATALYSAVKLREHALSTCTTPCLGGKYVFIVSGTGLDTL